MAQPCSRVTPLALAALLGGCAGQQKAPAPAVTEAAVERPPTEEPQEEMQVEGTLGTLSEEEIAGPFQRRWGEITRCYTEAQSKLYYLGGRVELKFRVGESGAPLKAFIASSSFGNYDAERCLLEIAASLRFSRPRGGKEAEFTYPLEFRSQGRVHDWDGGRISPFVEKKRGQLAACKAKTKAIADQPEGYSLTVYVEPGGRITSSGIAAEGPLDPDFAGCVTSKVLTWRVDDPRGKIAKATVEVP